MKNKKNILFYLLLMSVLSWMNAQEFHPGEIWKDTQGNPINAHGGGILFQNNTYYWYGEHKDKTNDARIGVTCYSSRDLYNWKYEGVALAVSNDPGSEIVSGCIIERPKVIYNKKNKEYIMWFHLELKDQGYKVAKTAVAVSKTPAGPFVYVKSYNPDAGYWPLGFKEEWKHKEITEGDLKGWTPEWEKEVQEGLYIRRDFKNGQMARDMTLFVDDNGKAYHIHSSEENMTLHISELTDDYKGFTGKYALIAPGGQNEAPALFKKDGMYYLITSGCTSWDPNAARSFRAKSIWGPWESLGNPAIGEDAETTFHSQSTFVLPVHGKKDAFIFMADRWRPKNPIDGRYIWLPLEFQNGRPVIRWKDHWSLKDFK
ncbi:glycoside hydrolase family 43 protein [uncultured Chryseobacterium sp.]|uniref:glycoside hydrolase family 43 protein n=1 Tax=uncultured Chryseobacterium sp. TaxID=259322 RepID=UPI0025F2BD2F|nr:glycoside hydrolase family 43 protein [uncultured Chryseobacterium sp.]